MTAVTCIYLDDKIYDLLQWVSRNGISFDSVLDSTELASKLVLEMNGGKKMEPTNTEKRKHNQDTINEK